MNTPSTQPAGTVYDIGYQRYEGPREGRNLARSALFIDGIKNSLGIGRGGWAKILPWIFVAPPLGTGLIFAAIAYFANQTLGAEVSDAIDLPENVLLFQISGFFAFLFAAVMGPELTCPDRRNRVFDLYLVRPITVNDYLASKWLAFLAIMLGVTLLPQLALWLGSLMAVPNAVEWVTDEWLIVPRMFASAAALAIFTTAFVFLISAMTDRRAIAAVITIGVIMVLPAVLGIVSAIAGLGSVTGALVSLLDPVGLPSSTVPSVIFGDDFNGSSILHPAVPLVWCAVLVAAFCAITWALYDNMRNR